jgi:hypothetical protein
MTPNNPVLQTMADTPIARGVHTHSIIAVAGNGPVEGSDDGVVKYSSSHLDGVDSEYIVRSGHSVQSNPMRSRKCVASCCFMRQKSAPGLAAAARRHDPPPECRL